MALSNKSMFLYGFQVSASNFSIDFKTASGGSILQASLNYGYYSLTSLGTEIVRALQAADPANTYTVTVDRTVSGGLQNRVTIATSGSHLDLLFGSGPRAAASVASLIGFTATDKTGATSYTGSSSAGTTLVPDFVGYNYLSPDFNHKVFGTLNVSASGKKEAVVFGVQKFWQVQFKYEPLAKVVAQWRALLDWMILQKPLEFTPDITQPTTFYEGTLEQNNLEYSIKEMLPQFPNRYDMGLMKFRQT